MPTAALPPISFSGHLFHGSPKRQAQPTFGEAGNTTPCIQAGRPFFVTDDHDYATRFARTGLISTLSVHLERIFDLTAEDEQRRLLAIFNSDPMILSSRGVWDEMVDGEIADSPYFLLESPEVMRHLLDEGFDGAYLREDIELGVDSYAIFRADRMRLVSTQPSSSPAACS